MRKTFKELLNNIYDDKTLDLSHDFNVRDLLGNKL